MGPLTRLFSAPAPGLVVLAAVAMLAATPACGAAERAPDPDPAPHPAAGSTSLSTRFTKLRDRIPECAGVELEEVVAGEVPAPCQDAISRLVDGCETSDLEALQRADDISETCRDALYALLPSEGTVSGLFVHLGTARADGLALLYVAATDAAGDARSLSGTDIEVIAEMHDGSEVALSGFTVAPLDTCESPILSMSAILDYSASMRGSDIREASALFQTLDMTVPAGCMEGDAIFFSAEVNRRSAFSSSPAEMAEAVAFDPAYPRTVTALFDGMGEGLVGLSDRDAPLRLLVVATDGKENASRTWTREALVSRASQRGVRMILLGSLLSDVDMMRDVAARTGGVFLFRPSLSSLGPEVQRLAEALKRLQVVTVRDPRISEARRIVPRASDAR